MSTAEMKEQLHQYIEVADKTDLTELFSFVGKLNGSIQAGDSPESALHSTADKWQDTTFVSEIESRYNSYKQGEKMISADEAKMRIKRLFDNHS